VRGIPVDFISGVGLHEAFLCERPLIEISNRGRSRPGVSLGTAEGTTLSGDPEEISDEGTRERIL